MVSFGNQKSSLLLSYFAIFNDRVVALRISLYDSKASFQRVEAISLSYQWQILHLSVDKILFILFSSMKN